MGIRTNSPRDWPRVNPGVGLNLPAGSRVGPSSSRPASSHIQWLKFRDPFLQGPVGVSGDNLAVYPWTDFTGGAATVENGVMTVAAGGTFIAENAWPNNSWVITKGLWRFKINGVISGANASFGFGAAPLRPPENVMIIDLQSQPDDFQEGTFFFVSGGGEPFVIDGSATVGDAILSCEKLR